MGIFRQFPYSNFHEMNLDEIIKMVRELADDWAEYQLKWGNLYDDTLQALNDFKAYVEEYWATLDLTEEVNTILRNMVNTGVFDPIIRTQLSPVVTDWLEDNITIPEGVVIDSSLSIAGACADAKETGERIYNVRSDLFGIAERHYNDVNSKINNLVQFWGLNRHGFINGNTGAYTSGVSGTGLNASTEYIMINKDYPVIIRNIAGNAIKCNIVQYDGSMSYITANYFQNVVFSVTPESNAKWIRLSFCTNDAGYDATAVFQPCNYASDIIGHSFWRNGSLGNIQNADGISTEYIIPRNDAESVTFALPIAPPDGFNYRFQISTYSVNSGTTWGNVGNRITRDFTAIPHKMNYTYKFTDNSIGFGVTLYLIDDNGVYSPLRIANFKAPDNVMIIKNFKNAMALNDYIIDSNFYKTAISINQIGVLSGIQAFCKWNGHYFSTNGTNLYEQDENFSLVDTYEINAGHGNTLQLGHNNNVYISGWNDNKVYVVNLTTKTVTNIISLPTTGTTTAVIDDINNIAYIFQKTSDPSVIDYYKLIKYNYSNNTILSERFIDTPFSAIQACDYIDGKIFVVNGLGTTANPNGFKIYNTNGDVIGEYIITSLTNVEPEGVYIDRETKNVFISTIAGTLYEIGD